MISLDKIAVLDAFHVGLVIITHASLVNFTWIQESLQTPLLLISRLELCRHAETLLHKNEIS